MSDPNGRILAEAHSADAPVVSVIASLPARPADTLYTRFGDWFAWACALLLLVALASPARARRTARAERKGSAERKAGAERTAGAAAP